MLWPGSLLSVRLTSGPREIRIEPRFRFPTTVRFAKGTYGFVRGWTSLSFGEYSYVDKRVTGMPNNYEDPGLSQMHLARVSKIQDIIELLESGNRDGPPMSAKRGYSQEAREPGLGIALFAVDVGGSV